MDVSEKFGRGKNPGLSYAKGRIFLVIKVVWLPVFRTEPLRTDPFKECGEPSEPVGDLA